MSEYKRQFERVKRFLGRVEDQNRELVDYEDDLWSFFQQSWHLKDWIKNDPSVPAAVRSRVENEVKKHQVLMICADLANRSKHLHLTRNRTGARSGGKNVVAVIKEKLSTSESTSSISWNHQITLQNGSTLAAVQLGRDAVAAWKQVLQDIGI